MKPLPQQDFVHTDFPAPRKKVKGIDVQEWTEEYADELLRKYWPHLYLPKPTKVDYEV